MRILICDDEMFVRAETKDTVLQVFPNAEIYDTGTAKDALAYAEQHSVDAALLDIEMPGMTGISLAKKLKETNPQSSGRHPKDIVRYLYGRCADCEKKQLCN